MAEAIRCQDAVRRLWQFLDGALDGADRDEVEQHLAFCLRCCGELEFAKELQTLLHASAAVQIPSEARSRLEGFIGDLDVEHGTDDGQSDDDGQTDDGVDRPTMDTQEGRHER